MKLLIRNLNRNTTETELKAMFNAHGIVQSCNLVIDKETGKSKGFGFVEMPKAGEAKAAMKTLNGKEVGGNKIRVKKAKPVDKKENEKNTSISNVRTRSYSKRRQGPDSKGRRRPAR